MKGKKNDRKNRHASIASGVVCSSLGLPEDMTVTQAAKHLGVARRALDALLNGRSSLSPEMALRIEKAFGQPKETLMRMQLAYDANAMRQREKEIAAEVAPYEAA